ncbi:MAG TPA: DnaD domain protein [Clostridia bacterium]|nr:DnaD domain protein [Clostridia bacterium]
MSYRVNPNSWGSIFPVPTQVVDNHIKLAGAIQLKVLLWFIRHASEEVDINKMSKEIGKTVEDINDALQFWVECGILVKEGQSPTNIPFSPSYTPPKASEEKGEKAKTLSPLPASKPTNEQIAVRCLESDDIKFLFNEAQKKMGKTIGYDGQSTLLMMLDTYGLPVEVILMILEYCVSVNKTSFNYIASVGKDWGEKEIDTLEKADEMIEELNACNSLWKRFSKAIGSKNPRPTKKQAEFLKRWSFEWKFSFDMIYLAYEEMADRTQGVHFSYMNTVLKNWHKAGLKTPEEVQEHNQQRLNSKTGKSSKRSKGNKPGNKNTASYDLDEFTRRALHEPLVYERGKKK